MIKLFDTYKRPFNLAAHRAIDSHYFAKRKDVAAAIALTKKLNKQGMRNYDGLAIFNSINGVFIADPVVKFENGLLRLGCHSFNKKTSRIIIRWANAK